MLNLSAKSKTRVALNNTLTAIAIGVFFLTINLREKLLFQKILVLQLVLAIPLLLTSTLAYAKVGYREKTEAWNLLAWITFILGYAFLLNVIGILLGNLIGIDIAIIFFLSSWILTLLYSFVDIYYNKSVIKERIFKDALFILVQFFLGVLVIL